MKTKADYNKTLNRLIITDGLSHIHRKLIIIMNDLKAHYNKEFKKPGRIVGAFSGKYNTDNSDLIYENLVLLTQSFLCRYPIFEGQGNFGSINDPMSFAKIRHTESRLTKYATLFKINILNGVNAQIPNILLNGSIKDEKDGVCYIPPHNLTEVMNACIHLLSNPNSNIDDIMRIISAPDYPSGANIVSPRRDIVQMYKNGIGDIKQRAIYEFDENDNVVISKLPQFVTSTSVIAQITSEIEKQEKTWVRKVLDETDNLYKSARVITSLDELSRSVRIVLYTNTTKDNIVKLMEHLFATTDLEKSLHVNMEIIDLDGNVEVKNLLDILQEWLEYRKLILKDELVSALNNTLDKLEIREIRDYLADDTKLKSLMVKNFKQIIKDFGDDRLSHVINSDVSKILTKNENNI